MKIITDKHDNVIANLAQLLAKKRKQKPEMELKMAIKMFQNPEIHQRKQTN
jgi:hypothetical protein